MSRVASFRVPRRPIVDRTAVAGALVTLVVLASCSSDGRDMRAPDPDQTASIITTTVPPVAFDTLPAIETVATAPIDSGAGSSVDGSGAASESTEQGRPEDSALVVDGFLASLPWPEGGEIDRRFTCDGEDVSPAISWTGVPEGTEEIAVVVLDPDADDYVHWIVAGIDPDLGQLRADDPLVQPDGTAIVGVNSAGTQGWTGPCPPDGQRHTYRFEVHALSQQTEMPTGAPADELLRAIDFATLYAAFGTGTYARS